MGSDSAAIRPGTTGVPAASTNARPLPCSDADCASRPILDQIANKWSMMALAVLDEPRRFNDIKRRLPGITQRVLTATLRKLERDGLVARQSLPASPVGVEYSITDLGESLREPFGQLYDWTVTHADTIRANQASYDRRTAGVV